MLCQNTCPSLWKHIWIHERTKLLKTTWFWLTTLSSFLVCPTFCPCWRQCKLWPSLCSGKMCALLNLWMLLNLQRSHCFTCTLIHNFSLRIQCMVPSILWLTTQYNVAFKVVTQFYISTKDFWFKDWYSNVCCALVV